MLKHIHRVSKTQHTHHSITKHQLKASSRRQPHTLPHTTRKHFSSFSDYHNNMSRQSRSRDSKDDHSNPLLSFQPGQFSTHLTELDMGTYERQYTTAVTTTNPEIKNTTKHDNIAVEIYYSPTFDTGLFTIPVQTYAIRIPIQSSGKVLQTCIKRNLSTTWRCRAIFDDIEVSVLPLHSQDIKFDHPETKYITPEMLVPKDKQFRRILLRDTLLPAKYSDFTPFESITNDDMDETYLKLMSNLPEDLQNVIKECNATFVPQTLFFTYPSFTYEEVLQALLPTTIIAPTSFTQTGHIVHFNLREDQLPYQYIIGRIACDKINGARTAINKVGMINNVFRNFQAEVLFDTKSAETHSKINNFICEIKEHGYSFTFDFSQVYWNSRLSHEHDRLSQYIHRSWVGKLAHIPGNPTKIDAGHNLTNTTYVLDLFAGVGPFVIPLVKKGGSLSSQHSALQYSAQNEAECVVWGNDINPKSSMYMYKNAQKNKLLVSTKDLKRIFFKEQHTKKQGKKNNNLGTDPTVADQKAKNQPSIPLRVFNSCGRELLKLVAKQQMLQLLHSKLHSKSDDTPQKSYMLPLFQHFIMNLPANAVEFLDMYVGMYTDLTMTSLPAAFGEKVLENHLHDAEYNPKIEFLPKSQFTILNIPESTQKQIELAQNSDAVLPPSFDDEYTSVIGEMDINDEKHHWSTLQALTMNSFHDTKAVQKSKNSLQFDTNANSNNQKDSIMSYSAHAPEHVLVPNPSDIKEFYAINQHNNLNTIDPQVIQHPTKNSLIVHCYCFVRDAVDPYGEALNLVEGHLGFQLSKASKIAHSIPASYNDQIISLGACDDLSTIPPIHLLSEQQSHLTTAPFLAYKNTQNLYKSKLKEFSKEKAIMEEELILMDYCIGNNGYYVHHVRNVAPQKDMMCVSFELPDYVLFFSPKMQQHWTNIAQTGALSQYEQDLFAKQQKFRGMVSYTTFVQNTIGLKPVNNCAKGIRKFDEYQYSDSSDVERFYKKQKLNP